MVVQDAQDVPKKSLLYMVNNTLTKSLENFLWAVDGSRSAPKSIYLQGNFAPVDTGEMLLNGR